MKRTKLYLLLTLTMAIIVTACSPSGTKSQEPATVPSAESAEIATEVPTEIVPTTSIEAEQPTPSAEAISVDKLRNGTYIVEGQSITLVNGEAENELAPGSETKQVTRYFGNEVNLDLNGDGLLDAAFLISQTSGGSGVFYYVVAAIKTGDGIEGTNAIYLGDRIAPQSTNVDPNNPAQFIVNYADRKPDEPMIAEPTIGVSKIIKLENNELVEVQAN